ncbi:MAG: hypothetical protein J3R72DRAFT_454278 [Linnemannia gamsii]|nr:MAG: hypothetical protein J3R72DRAFT_454278 [Linnemannia gamsii]
MFTTTQTDITTSTYAKLYKQLAHNLKETAPMNIKELTTAHVRKLMKACANDITTRNKSGLRVPTDKEADDAEIAQITEDLIQPLNKIRIFANEPLAKISYKWMKGNYCHYIAEYLTNHDMRKQKAYIDAALSVWFDAKVDTESFGLNPCDPLCLELRFSIAKLYHSMGLFRSARWANSLGCRAFCKAVDLGRLDEESRKLSEDILGRMERMSNHWINLSVSGDTGEMFI